MKPTLTTALTATALTLGAISAGHAAYKLQSQSMRGFQVNYVNGSLITSAPEKTQQFGAQFQWMPKGYYIVNGHLQMMLQLGYEYLNTTQKDHKTTAYDLGVGPMLRYNISPDSPMNLYLIAGAQPGYISKTQFGTRDLGIHFIFRDTLGAGIDFGSKKQFEAQLSFIHYSNFWFGKKNNGINLPLEFSLAYHF